MATINKVTKVFSANITEVEIQAHIDTQNNDGWRLIGVDNLVGWYRFFWAKDT